MIAINRLSKGKFSLQSGNSKDSISVLVAGDFVARGISEQLILSNRSEQIIGPITKLLMDKDFSIVNLEAPLTKRETGIKKCGPNIKMNPGCVEFLKVCNFDAVCTANNHTGDFGPEGVLDSLRNLKDNNILSVGSEANLGKSKQPLICNINGIRLAILAFTENEFGIAEADRAGTWPLDPLENIKESGLRKKGLTASSYWYTVVMRQTPYPAPGW